MKHKNEAFCGHLGLGG